MTDSNEVFNKIETEDINEIKIPETCETDKEISNDIIEVAPNIKEKTVEEVDLEKEVVNEIIKGDIVEKEENFGEFMGALLTSTENPKPSTDVIENEEEKENVEVEMEIDKPNETILENVANESNLIESGNNEVELCEEKQILENPVAKKIVSFPDGYTDSSQSSSSELQSSAAPFESSSSSQDNHYNANRIDFENAIESSVIWSEANDSTAADLILKPNLEPKKLDVANISEIPVITLDENTEPSAPAIEVPPVANGEVSSFVGPGLPPPGDKDQPIVINDSPEVSANEAIRPEPEPIPIPILPPAPRKRGRPRKQVLPNPSPIVESWGANAQEFPSLNISAEGKRSARAERRQVKKKKFDEMGERGKQYGDDGSTRKRYIPKSSVKKKKRRATYTPKKKLPPPKKKHSELENIQNFEEETRMSASEGPTGFSSRTGAMGDESQGSSMTTEGHTKSTVNKKGRMEIMTDGCKPVTVQQIVEYFWPPPSSLSPGEKPEGLMIQEQITEYLGVKSFKRKYPSIKRRPVDMEERNYLQENGFVSENMCDMGLTAVFSADILEIMYNDFPQKFEEYRKYTREKKAKEQRALRERQAAERADMDPKKEAIESAHSWNTEFNKTRREKRASCFDLQTFTVHFPANRYKQISLGKPGNYPVALIPGQNTDYYKKYTSNELKYFPLNTVLYGPLRPNERHFPLPGGSDGSQSEIDDSSSSEDSSSSSSEETQDTEETNSTAEEEQGSSAFEPKMEKFHQPEEKETPKIGRGAPKTPKGRGRGKVNNNQPPEQKKRLGRPPKMKMKLAAIKLKRLEGEEVSGIVKEEKMDVTARVIIHTCKMCHEEESKNKNGEFESFIECSQCNGKIHPSCIDLTAEMIPKISSYGWQCTDCKSCVKCGQSSSEDKMIFCDQCDRGYHIFCVGLNEVPSGNYICGVCKPTVASEVLPSVENGVEIIKVEDSAPEIKEEFKTEDENSDKCNS